MSNRRKNQLESGNFRVQVYIGKDDNGKRIYKSFTEKTKTEAKRQAEIYKAQFGNRNKPKNMTVSNAIDNYIALRQTTLSPTTIKNYKGYKKYLDDKFPYQMISDLVKFDSDDMQYIIDEMVKEKLSSKSVRNRIALITSALDHYDIKLKKYQLPSKEQAEIFVPSDEQMKTIFRVAKGTDMEVPIMLASFGAMRCGEVLGLRDDAINGNIIHVYRTSYYGGAGIGEQIKDIPKTISSNRYIPMPDSVINAIQTNGLPIGMTHKTIDSHFYAILRKAELPKFKFHSLRHWCISSLHAQGFADQYIMKISGHSSVSTLQKVYRHTLADREKELTDRAISHFDSFVQN